MRCNGLVFGGILAAVAALDGPRAAARDQPATSQAQFYADLVYRCDLGGCGEDASNNNLVSATPRLLADRTISGGDHVDLYVDSESLLACDPAFLVLGRPSFGFLFPVQVALAVRFSGLSPFQRIGIPVAVAGSIHTVPLATVGLDVPPDADRVEMYLSYTVEHTGSAAIEGPRYISDYGTNFVLPVGP